MKTDYFDKAAQQFANLMIEKIQQVEDNWQKPWITIAANTRNFFPQNLTGRRYAGGNAFLLLFLCEKFQYQTPVFMTFNQAKEAGISVLKGSKSFPVYYFLFYVYHKETRKKITFEEYKALSREQQQEYNVIPTYKYYSVFNLDQTNFSDVRPEEWEALREKFRGGQAEQPDGTTGEAHPEIDAMLEAKSWFCPIREQQGDRAFYSPLADYIVVPLRSQFVDMQSFYETLLHEMGHSTGHPTRLNRDLAHPFGSEEYGKEELTAEFAAALAGMFFGIAEHIRTENAAYLKSWIKAIREEPKFILNVLADAMKIVKMIAGKLNISVESEETAADEAELYAHLLGKYRGYDGDFFQFYLGTDDRINRALLENLGIKVEPDKYPDYDSRIVAQVVQGKKRFDIYPFELEAFNRYAMFGNNNALSCLKGISPTAGQTVRENGINEYGNALNWSLFWIKANPEDKALLVDHVLNIPER